MHRSRHEALPFLPPSGSSAHTLAISFILLAPFLLGFLALHLGQDSNWDLRNYHWYNAYALLNDRFTYDLLPSQTPFFYTPFLDVPFYLLGTHVGAQTAAFVMGTAQGLNISLLFILAHATLLIPNAWHKIGVCAALALFGVLGAGSIAQIGTTFYDNVTSLGLFASAALVMRLFPTLLHDSNRIALSLVFLCGLPSGLLMGLKLPFMVFGLALTLAFLFGSGTRARRLLLAIGFGSGALFGFVVSFGPWAMILYQDYGSPLFPYFNDLFRSAYAPLENGRDMQFLPRGIVERTFYPYIFSFNPLRVGEIPWQDFRIALFYTLLPIAVVMRLLYGRNKNEPTRIASFYAKRYLLWTGILSYFMWLLLFGIYRYLLPLEMLAPLLIVLLMGLLPMRTEPKTLITLFLLVLLAVTTRPGDWGRRSEGWLSQTVEVTRPKLSNTSDLMIVMAGTSPYAHVLPAFPKESRVVRIQSNLTSPDKPHPLNKKIRKLVLTHKGHYKLLIPAWDLEIAKEALSFFKLSVNHSSCQDVIDHLYDSQLKLCDLTKKVIP